MSAIGSTQIAVLRAVKDGGVFEADTRSAQNSCLKLHDRGLLRRDPSNSFRWTCTDAGNAELADFEDDPDRRSGWMGELVADRQRRAPYAGRDDE